MNHNFSLYANLNPAGKHQRGKPLVLHDQPKDPLPPTVVNISTTFAFLEWDAVGQGVSILKLQAIAMKKHSKAPWKKFNPRKSVGRETVITNGADVITSAAISGLKPNTTYIFRLSIANMTGAACGESTEPIKTSPCENRRRSLFTFRKKGKEGARPRSSDILFSNEPTSDVSEIPIRQSRGWRKSMFEIELGSQGPSMFDPIVQKRLSCGFIESEIKSEGESESESDHLTY
eukprot:m.40460 g.40460  ORF g.40460 m.40460 type:complete len:232 (-) comp6929_c0_seq1:97-792(-)